MVWFKATTGVSEAYPPGITHSVVIQRLSYQNEKVCVDRNDYGTTTDENQNKARVWGKSGTGRSQNSFREITGKVRTMPGGLLLHGGKQTRMLLKGTVERTGMPLYLGLNVDHVDMCGEKSFFLTLSSKRSAPWFQPFLPVALGQVNFVCLARFSTGLAKVKIGLSPKMTFLLHILYKKIIEKICKTFVRDCTKASPLTILDVVTW